MSCPSQGKGLEETDDIHPMSTGMKTALNSTKYQICRYAGVSLSVFRLYNSEFYLENNKKSNPGHL